VVLCAELCDPLSLNALKLNTKGAKGLTKGHKGFICTFYLFYHTGENAIIHLFNKLFTVIFAPTFLNRLNNKA
jgi:hypothetical protein